MKNYIALIEVDGDTYGVVFPDFPGLTTVADSFEEAVQQAHEALAMHAEGILSDGDPLPEPRTLSQIRTAWPDWSDWEGSDYFVSSIALLPSFGTQKVVVSIDAALVAKIDAVTKNRSAFIASAAQWYIDAGSGLALKKETVS